MQHWVKDYVWVLAGASITLPQGYWQLHANKTQVLCMTHELAEWNDHLNHAAQECAMLASQVLVSLQDAIEKRMSDLLQVLDSLALLDVLSGFVAYMQSQSSMCSFSRPTLCKERGPETALTIKTVRLRQ